MLIQVISVKFTFIKYLACGNAFLLKDDRAGLSIPDVTKSEVVSRLCDCNLGVGADCILFLENSRDSNVRLRVFDSTVREVIVSGDGLLCVADYLFSKTVKNSLLIETGDGVKKIVRKGKHSFQVNMGSLKYQMRDLKRYCNGAYNDDEVLLEKNMDIPDLGSVTLSIVALGDPRVIIFSDIVQPFNLKKYVAAISNNLKLFPKGVHLDFCQVENDAILHHQTVPLGFRFEINGSGAGAAACAKVGQLTNKIRKNPVTVISKNSELKINFNNNHILLTGSSEAIFQDSILLKLDYIPE